MSIGTNTSCPSQQELKVALERERERERESWMPHSPDHRPLPSPLLSVPLEPIRAQWMESEKGIRYHSSLVVIQKRHDRHDQSFPALGDEREVNWSTITIFWSIKPSLEEQSSHRTSVEELVHGDKDWSAVSTTYMHACTNLGDKMSGGLASPLLSSPLLSRG